MIRACYNCKHLFDFADTGGEINEDDECWYCENGKKRSEEPGASEANLHPPQSGKDATLPGKPA